jgi:hypothetical protein
VAERRRHVKPPLKADQAVEEVLADVTHALHTCDEIADRLGTAAMLKGCGSASGVLFALSEMAGPESGHNPEKADTTMRYMALGTDRVVATMRRLHQAEGLGEMVCAQCRMLVTAKRRDEARPSDFGQAAVAVAYRAARDAAGRLLAMEGGR